MSLTGGEREGAARPGYRRTALIIACALFMENLDSTVLTTALPTMARDFGVAAPRQYVRLSYATAYERLEEAVDRLRTLFNR